MVQSGIVAQFEKTRASLEALQKGDLRRTLAICAGREFWTLVSQNIERALDFAQSQNSAIGRFQISENTAAVEQMTQVRHCDDVILIVEDQKVMTWIGIRFSSKELLCAPVTWREMKATPGFLKYRENQWERLIEDLRTSLIMFRAC